MFRNQDYGQTQPQQVMQLNLSNVNVVFILEHLFSKKLYDSKYDSIHYIVESLCINVCTHANRLL
jgi:hypothetical protein